MWTASITAYGHIKDGRLILSNPKRFKADLSFFKNESIVELTIRKKNKRSTQQNRYMFGVVYKELEIRMRELGNDVDVDIVHEFCKERFNPEAILGPGGEIIGNKGGSTTEMNKDQFGVYLDKIIKFAAEILEIEIPLPNTELKMFD